MHATVVSAAKSPNLFGIEKPPLLSTFRPLALFSGTSPFFHSLVRERPWEVSNKCDSEYFPDGVCAVGTLETPESLTFYTDYKFYKLEQFKKMLI